MGVCFHSDLSVKQSLNIVFYKSDAIKTCQGYRFYRIEMSGVHDAYIKFLNMHLL